MFEVQNLFVPFVFSLTINGLGTIIAVRKNHLKFPSGALAALIVGVGLLTFSFFAWILLLLFFISASLLTKFRASMKLEVQDIFDKGGQRDSGQVFANGLPPVLFMIILTVSTGFDPLSPLFIALATYIAAVTADTFSTEIGTLAESPPRWILNPRKMVVKGTSGGITSLGLIASALGALEIATLYFIGTFLIDSNTLSISLLIAFCIIFIGGVLGGLIDSLLGASVQGFYHCPTCNIGTEKKVHTKCGNTHTQLIRGWVFVTNDWVNLLAATSASLITGFLSLYLL